MFCQATPQNLVCTANLQPGSGTSGVAHGLPDPSAHRCRVPRTMAGSGPNRFCNRLSATTFCFCAVEPVPVALRTIQRPRSEDFQCGSGVEGLQEPT